MATRSSKKKMIQKLLDLESASSLLLQTPLLQQRVSCDMSTSPDTSLDEQLGPSIKTHLSDKMAFSCPKPPAGPYTADYRLAGLSEPRVSRKRPFREELESVKEEGSTARIMVYVRLRPIFKNEKDSGARSCVRIVNKRDVYLTELALDTDYLRLKRLKGRHFVFDAAFPDATGQLEVYNSSTAELVEGVLQGRNGSVFCYGATGAGKTHTMLGSVQSPGVMVLALKDLFAKLRQRCREENYVVHLSYLEVYNESVRDLLSPGRPLVLREDSKQGTVAAGLTQFQTYSADEVMALLQQGNRNRTTEPTRANETSSRSHAILQVTVEYKTQQESHWVRRTGKLSLIDLAGSERALATDQRTIRSLEGANINRSLLALSSCINALVEGKKHIPFRNSKLTQLLKDSLGGSCQTSMIANISPSHLTFGETQNTLHWADRAKQIRTKACEASEEVQPPESSTEQTKLLLEVQKENQQLRMQLARMQQKMLAMESTLLAIETTTPGQQERQRHQQQQQEEDRRTVEELRRKVQALEKERDQNRRDLAELATREENQASLHGRQLREKDDLIRTLCRLDNGRRTEATAATPGVTGKTNVEQESSAMAMGLRKVMTRGSGAEKGAARRMSMIEARSYGGLATPSAGAGGARRIKLSHAPPSKSGAEATEACTPRRTTRRSAYQELENSEKPSTRAAHHFTTAAAVPPPPTKLQHSSTTPAIATKLQHHSGTMAASTTNSRRLSRIPHPPPATVLPPAKTPLKNKVLSTPSGKLFRCAPDGGGADEDELGGGRKRTFWDITNANSPSAPLARCTRSNTAATPSMLLQPGFLGGRRRLL